MATSEALFDIEPPAKPVSLVKQPTARRVAETYEDFVAEAEPAFERAAEAGIEFTSFDIAKREDLPDPPNPKANWGRFIHGLHQRGVIEHVGWAESKRPEGGHSAVKTWRGVRPPELGAA